MSAVPLPPTARSERPPRSDGIVQPQGKGETEATKRDILAWYKERAATSGRPLSRDEARNRSPPPSVKKRRTNSPAADARHAQRAQHRDSGEAADVPQSSARPALPTDQIDTAHEPESGGIRLDELIDARGHEARQHPSTSSTTRKPRGLRRYRQTSRRLRIYSSTDAPRRKSLIPRPKSILGAIFRSAPGRRLQR